MSAERTLAQLRRFLLSVSAGLCVGTVIELSLTEHTQGIQLLPFGLCGVGLLAVLWMLLRPGRAAAFSLRAVMGLVALGSLFGVYEHLEHNAGFYLEIQPNAATSEVIWGALSGANPLLAPGILALAALLACAATYDHPVLNRSA
jgi:hypothetical protein